MRLLELCLALLYAAGTGTEPPRAARERPLAPGAAAGRGVPGAARVDPRQAWMLLAGSPERVRSRTGAHTAPAGDGSPGKPNSAALAAPTMPEELLRELQLLLRGTGVGEGRVGTAGQGKAGLGSRAKKSEGSLPNVKLWWGLGSGMAKMCRTAGEGCKEESSKSSPEAGAQRRVEAAFHCQTCEDIAVEQKRWQELGLFYIVSAEPAPFPCLQGHLPWHRDSSSNSSHSLSQPEREGMFHRGPGLNLTSGQYTAPIAGYYIFTTTLHIGEPSPQTAPGPCRDAVWDGSQPLLCHSAQGAAEEGAGMATEPPAGADLCAVPLPAQQVWQGKLGGGKESRSPGKGGACSPPPLSSLFCSHLETVSRLESSSDLFTISVTGTLYLQVSAASSTGDSTGQEGAFPGSAQGWAAGLFSGDLQAPKTIRAELC
ncbi:hypothetical protein Nmel_011524 [Mimus melanotis]